MGYDLIVESVPGKGSTFKIVMGERAGRPVKEQETDTRGETTQPMPVVPAATKRVAARGTAKPDATKTPAASSARPAVHSGLQGMKVLVVDDEKDSRLLIAHYLEEFGCTVTTAGSGEQGLQLAREHLPDLMTLDLVMPGLTGWEVLKQLKSDPDLRRIPVVIVSVVAGEGQGSLRGAVDLVTKPFEREDLLRVLWRHLGRSRGGRILLVTSDARIRDALTTFLRERGLDVVMPGEGKGTLEALNAELPDALLLDIAPHGPVTMDVLGQIRANRLYAGVPTFVLADDDLETAERDRLQDLMTIVVSRTDPAGALDDLLGALFPAAAAAERRA
jgi:CheY-like chemotaxis protein